MKHAARIARLESAALELAQAAYLADWLDSFVVEDADNQDQAAAVEKCHALAARLRDGEPLSDVQVVAEFTAAEKRALRQLEPIRRVNAMRAGDGQ